MDSYAYDQYIKAGPNCTSRANGRHQRQISHLGALDASTDSFPGFVESSNSAVPHPTFSQEEARQGIAELEILTEAWLHDYKNSISEHAHKFNQQHMSANAAISPFGQFYALFKIHKGMKDGAWPTRPVCSDVTSLAHGLGK
eukprot:scaffold10339_cov41-Cyclotella_meneghiniana.AAC.4